MALKRKLESSYLTSPYSGLPFDVRSETPRSLAGITRLKLSQQGMIPVKGLRIGRLPRHLYRICAVLQRSYHVTYADPDASEFKNWSGARDLNPGPHGPEPCVVCHLFS